MKRINESPALKTCLSHQGDGYGDFGAALEHPKGGPLGFITCPYGEVGSILWGRETSVYRHKHDKYYYKADHIDSEPYAHNGWKPSIHMPKAAARIWDEITGIRVERVADISEEDCIAEGIEPVGEKLEFGGTQYSGKWYKNYLPGGYTFLRPYDSYRSLWQLINGKPKAIQERQNGKLVTIGYEVYPFDEQAAAPFKYLTSWRGKPLTVIANPWVWVIESKQLSVNGKP